jgi:hypothetical protein
VVVPEEVARQSMTAAGLPDWLAIHLIGAYRLIRHGDLQSTTDDVNTLTGQSTEPLPSSPVIARQFS